MHVWASTASASRTEAFPRSRRIGARRDFRDAYESGAKQQGRFVAVFARARAEGGLRLGITATRKAGGAVQRNRARRRVREIFRRWRAAAPDPAVDVVVNVFAGAIRAPYAVLRTEVAGLLARATEAASKAVDAKGAETK